MILLSPNIKKTFVYTRISLKSELCLVTGDGLHIVAQICGVGHEAALPQGHAADAGLLGGCLHFVFVSHSEKIGERVQLFLRSRRIRRREKLAQVDQRKILIRG